MKIFNKINLLFCGVVLMLAAFPVLAQDIQAPEYVINEKPLRDFADLLRQKIDNKVDLNAPFIVELESVLDKNGRLDAGKSKFIRSDGNEEIVDIAKSAIEAINNSGFLIYLRDFNAGKINLSLVQNESQTYAVIVLEQISPEKAKTAVSGFNTLLKTIALMDQNGVKKLDENSKFFIGGINVSSQSNKFTLGFIYPKAEFHAFIKRNLEESKGK